MCGHRISRPCIECEEWNGVSRAKCPMMSGSMKTGQTQPTEIVSPFYLSCQVSIAEFKEVGVMGLLDCAE